MKVGFIVEGSHDERALREMFQKHFPEITPLFALTHGTKCNNRAKMNIRAVEKETPHIFYMVDSDTAGDGIYKSLSKEFNYPRIELDAEMCKCVRGNRVKIGVEHASSSYLFQVLQIPLVMLYSTTQAEHSLWDMGKVTDAPLVGFSQMLSTK